MATFLLSFLAIFCSISVFVFKSCIMSGRISSKGIRKPDGLCRPVVKGLVANTLLFYSTPFICNRQVYFFQYFFISCPFCAKYCCWTTATTCHRERELY